MFIFLINFRKKPKFGANFDEIAIFGMKLQNFGRWRLISALDMRVFFSNDLITHTQSPHQLEIIT